MKEITNNYMYQIKPIKEFKDLIELQILILLKQEIL